MERPDARRVMVGFWCVGERNRGSDARRDEELLIPIAEDEAAENDRACDGEACDGEACEGEACDGEALAASR